MRRFATLAAIFFLTVRGQAEEEEPQLAKRWPFTPVTAVTPPEVTNTNWVSNPIDAFILSKLEARGIEPAPLTKRRALVRRLYFDLLGVPPEPAVADAFVNDRSPLAYERLVDQLLNDPRYGERWGRHWLDLARYADTHGLHLDNERSMWPYRDWVVRSFNEDLPYDQFIQRQLAADLLLAEGSCDRVDLAAMGFLTLGRRFLGVEPDIIDDRIDVVTRGVLALTVSCARCHDHKFDPIPTADYYALYGVFKSSRESLQALDPKTAGQHGELLLSLIHI